MTRLGVGARAVRALLGAAACAALGMAPANAATAKSGDTITYTIETSHKITEGLAFIQQSGSEKLYFAGMDVPALPFPVSFSFDSAKAAKVDRTILLGKSTYGGEDHLVIGTDVSFATGAVGQDFSAVFTGYDESTLLGDLDTLATGTGDAYTKAYDDVISFGLGVGGLASDPAFKPPMAYDLLSFSTGTIIGGGTVTEDVQAAVPEPAGWATMIGGIGMAGGVLRRRRSAGRAAATA